MLTDTQRGPFEIKTHSHDQWDFFGTKRTVWGWEIIGRDGRAMETGEGHSCERGARVQAERIARNINA